MTIPLGEQIATVALSKRLEYIEEALRQGTELIVEHIYGITGEIDALEARFEKLEAGTGPKSTD